jgi:hypothetical protein
MKAARKNPPTVTNEHGSPSPAARKKIPKMKCARPKDFFDLQITPTCSEAWMTPHLQRRFGRRVLFPCMDLSLVGQQK